MSDYGADIQRAAMSAGRRLAMRAERPVTVVRVHEREVRMPDGTVLIERYIEEVTQ